ncbi:hypothetical protein TWF481_004905 [Arthrobotrys musiformis]|uniref:Uncharacterized protein n=1 Tax=Arthrobotrys musiformis TaxID=47236 RepID=A0AAV9WKX6_9PEZI
MLYTTELLIKNCQLTTKEFLELSQLSKETKIFGGRGFACTNIRVETFRDAEKALEGRSAYAQFGYETGTYVSMRKYNKLIQNGAVEDMRERCNRFKADWMRSDLERLLQLAEDMKNSRGKPIREKMAPLFFIRSPEACRLQ